MPSTRTLALFARPLRRHFPTLQRQPPGSSRLAVPCATRRPPIVTRVAAPTRRPLWASAFPPLASLAGRFAGAITCNITRVTRCPGTFAAVFGGFCRRLLRHLHPRSPAQRTCYSKDRRPFSARTYLSCLTKSALADFVVYSSQVTEFQPCHHQITSTSH